MQLGSSPKKGTEDKAKELPPSGTHIGFCYRVIDCGWCVYEFQRKPVYWEDGQRKCRTEARMDFEIWPQDIKTGEWITLSTGKPFSISPGFQG